MFSSVSLHSLIAVVYTHVLSIGCKRPLRFSYLSKFSRNKYNRIWHDHDHSLKMFSSNFHQNQIHKKTFAWYSCLMILTFDSNYLRVSYFSLRQHFQLSLHCWIFWSTIWMPKASTYLLLTQSWLKINFFNKSKVSFTFSNQKLPKKPVRIDFTLRAPLYVIFVRE